MVTGWLSWIGARARWILLIGAFGGLAFPAGSAVLRPLLPYLVAVVYAVAMLRIDPIMILKGLMNLRRALSAAAVSFGILVVAPLVAFGLARALGLGPDYEAVLVYTLTAPPIASAAALCLIIGFDARVALELTVVTSLAMPFTGPAVAGLLLGDALALDPVALGLRMAAMIFGGFVLAMLGRGLFGVARIERNAAALDGLAALVFLAFVMSVFDGIGPSILAHPGRSLAYLALATLLVLGGGAVVRFAPGAPMRNGALGIVWGTRSVAIYLAALPPDPLFALYVGLYQFPMAAIVMVFRRVKPGGGADEKAP